MRESQGGCLARAQCVCREYRAKDSALYPPPQSCKQAHDTPPRAWYHSEVIEAVASCCLALRWQQAMCVAAFPARAAARATHLEVGSEARQLRYLLRRWRLCSAFARCPSDTWRTAARLHAQRAPTFASTQQATAAAASIGHRASILCADVELEQREYKITRESRLGGTARPVSQGGGGRGVAVRLGSCASVHPTGTAD